MFGMMHFLSVFFAPRIKDLGTLELYSFVSQKQYAEQGYILLPDHYINEKLIETHWDDMLRVMVSLKLGKTTAFQVLKRMNSYAKQNPLQKAFKEFGKIIRTAFILRYYDDLELRQSVEKQLSHIEMMNRFAKARILRSESGISGSHQARAGKNHSVPTADPECDCALELLILIGITCQDRFAARTGRNDLGNPEWNRRYLAACEYDGEYDSIKLLDNKPLRFDLERIFQWKYAPKAKESVG